MQREAMLARLVQNGAFLADGEVIEAISRGASYADRTKIALRVALDKLEEQGFIKFVPAEEWPEFILVGGSSGG